MNLNKRADAFCRAVTLELAKLRTEAGLSQNQLSTPSGLHQTAINLLESGKRAPSVATLYRLAEALGTSPSDILAAAQRAMAEVKAEVVEEPVKIAKPRIKKATPKTVPRKAVRKPKA